MSVKPIPEGYHVVSPYLIVAGVPRLIDFLEGAFDAKEITRLAGPDGIIMHAQVRIGDSVVMLGEARGEWPPMPGSLYFYVIDTDATYRRALQAGGTSIMEPSDQFYGDRNAGVKDPSGNIWWIATRKEDLSDDEIAGRVKDFMKP